MEWKDVSSYSRSDKERIPTTWSVIVGGFDVIVTRIVHCPDTWFMRSRTLGIDSKELKSKDITNAKGEALSILITELRGCIERMNTALIELEQSFVTTE